MMKLRNWCSLNKAEKIGRKKALKEAFFAFFFMNLLILGSAFGSMLGRAMKFSQSLTDIIWCTNAELILVLFIVVAITFCFSIWIYSLKKKQYISDAYDMVSRDFSKALVEKHLPRGEYCKVRIVNTRDYKDFITKLADEGDSYAILGTQDNLVTLYIKIDGTNTYRWLDTITKEEFLSYCELL